MVSGEAHDQRVLKKTFQSFDEVSIALSLAGIKDGWSRTAKQMGCTSKEIEGRLNKIVHRRNQIVHEGDIKRALRPRQLQYNEIGQKEIVADLDWIEQLLNSIDVVVVSDA